MEGLYFLLLTITFSLLLYPMSRGKLNYSQKGNLFYPPFAPLCWSSPFGRVSIRSAFSLLFLSLFSVPIFSFFFSSFFLISNRSEKSSLVFNRSYRSSFSVVRDGFFSVVFLLYPPYLLSFQRFSTRSRGLCTRFLFPDFLLIFSLVSEERAEE